MAKGGQRKSTEQGTVSQGGDLGGTCALGRGHLSTCPASPSQLPSRTGSGPGEVMECQRKSGSRTGQDRTGWGNRRGKAGFHGRRTCLGYRRESLWRYCLHGPEWAARPGLMGCGVCGQHQTGSQVEGLWCAMSPEEGGVVGMEGRQMSRQRQSCVTRQETVADIS